MVSDHDLRYMKLAINLAKKGEGFTSPNPMVGAVLVKNKKILGKGYHKKAGLPHAEIEAFNDAYKKGKKIAGSTLYVSLEPCCHDNKRTPPCTESIINNKISKVFIGSVDPNPLVGGKGVKSLEASGIQVITGVLEDESRSINEIYNKYITTMNPFVILKMASTLDGKIATSIGDSKWIGSEKQRKIAHKLRHSTDGILVGINTILKDNPSLNVRLNRNYNSQPVPIILDSSLRIPLKSNVIRIHESPIVFTTKESSRKKKNKLKNLKNIGVRVFDNAVDSKGRVSLKKVIKFLGKHGFSSVLIEGGSRISASALSEKIVDKVVFFYSPKIIGGDGIDMVSNLNIKTVGKALTFREVKFKNIGKEMMIEAYI